MDRAAGNLEIRIERTLQTSPDKAYDAWLDPKVPGTPWNAASKLVFDGRVDGLFYSRMKDTPHYGLFTVLERGREIRHTWMSPYTDGRESVVTVTFSEAGNDTLMVLVHTGLPDNDNGQAHRKGWTFFMDSFPRQFAPGA
jgi:uncharacterized protein YndB with AHSA1/START domain